MSREADAEDKKKKICKLFDQISIKYGMWQAWADCMVMIATSISNTLDTVNRPSREDRYQSVRKKYSNDELKIFPEIMALIVECMDENPDQDLLGDLYMRLELGNKNGGQFFTPYNLCCLMAKLQEGIEEEIKEKGWAKVNDPACGAGALLIAYANECRRKGINYQEQILFVGQDIDYTTGCMAYIQLSLLGCPGMIVIGDTLTNPYTEKESRGIFPKPSERIWYTPMYFHDKWVFRRMAEAIETVPVEKPEEPEQLSFMR